MKDALVVSLLSAVPKNRAAWGMGALTRLHLPRWAHLLLIRWFARRYGVDLSECDRPLADYPTFTDFFVRGLPPGARPIDPAADALVSPCDGRVHTISTVTGGRFQQADGREASVGQLLGSDVPDGSTCAVLYLAPHNYHRVHAPFAARISALDYRPGTLWPVFPGATTRVAELFGNNERLVFWLERGSRRIAAVMVGAFGVGRMSTPLDPIVTNTGHPATRIELDHRVAAGDEIGTFGLGSTVILVSAPGALVYEVRPGDVLRMGQRIGRLS
jgi:phosphatidylserine decarboxylase